MPAQTTRHRGAVGATLTGVLDRLGRKPAGVSLEPDDRLDDRHVLITGANRGLGKGIATRIASLGATVWMACRSDATWAVTEVRAAAGHDRVHALHVDLTDRATVEALVASLVERGVTLDVVISNAGMVPARARTTAAGLDVMFHVNFVGPVVLIDALLAADRVAAVGRQPRLVFVGSESHRSAPPIDWEQFAQPRAYGPGRVVAEYGASKLLLHTWVAELARRTEGTVAVHHLCPGAVNTDIAREAPGWVRPVLRGVFKVAFQDPRKAAAPVAWLATASEIEGTTGVYLHMTRRKQASPQALDPAQGARLWDEVHRVIATGP